MSYTVSAQDLNKIRLNEPETVNSVLQNVALILATPKGSSPMYRDFGLDQSFLDKPLPVAKVMLRVAVKEAIEDWEPRAGFVGMDFAGDPVDPASLCPVVIVEVLEE